MDDEITVIGADVSCSSTSPWFSRHRLPCCTCTRWVPHVHAGAEQDIGVIHDGRLHDAHDPLGRGGPIVLPEEIAVFGSNEVRPKSLVKSTCSTPWNVARCGEL